MNSQYLQNQEISIHTSLVRSLSKGYLRILHFPCDSISNCQCTCGVQVSMCSADAYVNTKNWRFAGKPRRRSQARANNGANFSRRRNKDGEDRQEARIRRRAFYSPSPPFVVAPVCRLSVSAYCERRSRRHIRAILSRHATVHLVCKCRAGRSCM